MTGTVQRLSGAEIFSDWGLKNAFLAHSKSAHVRFLSIQKARMNDLVTVSCPADVGALSDQIYSPVGRIQISVHHDYIR
jgi:hypothetical protein